MAFARPAALPGRVSLRDGQGEQSLSALLRTARDVDLEHDEGRTRLAECEQVIVRGERLHPRGSPSRSGPTSRGPFRRRSRSRANWRDDRRLRSSFVREGPGCTLRNHGGDLEEPGRGNARGCAHAPGRAPPPPAQLLRGRPHRQPPSRPATRFREPTGPRTAIHPAATGGAFRIQVSPPTIRRFPATLHSGDLSAAINYLRPDHPYMRLRSKDLLRIHLPSLARLYPGVRCEPGRAEVRLPNRGRLPALRPRIPGPHPALQRLVAGDRYARHGAGLSHGPQHEPLRGGGAPLRPRSIPRRRDRQGTNDRSIARIIERSTPPVRRA